MTYLLDTNVLSEIRKSDPNPNVRAWRETVDANDLYVSVLVVGEIRRGIELLRRRDPAQANVFDTWLSTLQRDYFDRVLPVTEGVAETWGRQNVPNPLPAIDGLMAATASVHGFIFVTRDTGDLASTGVQLLNPFEGEGQG